ncbi:hypothetical protein QBC37DRAFT_238537, partial [Rhypophila decipiens]
WDYSSLARLTGKTIRQIEYACQSPLTPRKTRSGRRPLISTPQKESLRRLLQSDILYRKLPWSDLRYYIPGFEVYGEGAILTALRSL